MNKKLAAARDLKTVRRFSNAGLMDCRKALKDSGGDVHKALSSLMSDDDIHMARSSLRVRQCGGMSIKDPPTKQEIQIVERLYLDLVENVERGKRVQAALQEGSVPTEGPPELPPGAASYDQLVEMIEALDVSPADYDSFVAATMALGFNREDATYILDRMGAGRFRAVAEMNGAGRSVPDKRSDPIAYATYRKSPHRRKWWRFWEA